MDAGYLPLGNVTRDRTNATESEKGCL